MGLKLVGILCFAEEENRNGMVTGGGNGVKISFVVLVVLNRNAFQNVSWLVGIIQLEREILMAWESEQCP